MKKYVSILNTTIYKSLIVMLLVNTSCSNNNNNNSVNQIDEAQISKNILISKVNELRLREEPSTTSKVLYVITENEEVTDLNEKTDFKETIRMRGVKYTEPWLKVKTKDGIEGWAFGGGLKPKNPIKGSNEEKNNSESNKKYIKDMSPKTLSKILSIEIDNDFPKYEGYYECYTTANNIEILHGEFSVKAELKRPELGEMGDMGVAYTGHFTNGTKNGKFVETGWVWESEYTTTLYYEASNQCSWGKADFFSEGSALKYKVENPTNCTFSYVAEEAGKKGEWGHDGVE